MLYTIPSSNNIKWDCCIGFQTNNVIQIAICKASSTFLKQKPISRGGGDDFPKIIRNIKKKKTSYCTEMKMKTNLCLISFKPKT